MAEISLETEAILNRLKREGDLTRNSGKNSIKQVNINLEKLHTTFKAINTAMANNTAAIKQVSAAEMKIQQEAAERARRQGELEEVAQGDALKAAELRAKADALRAKQELKEARGPGLFQKMNENKFSLLKTFGLLAGTGFVVGNLVKGVLDSASPGWDEKFTTSLSNLSNIDLTIEKSIQSLSTQLTTGIQKTLEETFTLSNLFGGGIFGKVLSGALGIGLTLLTVGGTLTGIARITDSIRAAGGIKKWSTFWKASDDVKAAKEVKRANTPPKKTPGAPGSPAPSQMKFDFNRTPPPPTLGEKLKKAGTDALDDIKMKDGVTKGLVKTVGRAALPVYIGMEVADAVEGYQTENLKNAQASLDELLKSEKRTLGEAFVGAAAGASTGAIVGAGTGALAGGVGAGPGALAGAAYGGLIGLITGTARVVYDEIKDMTDDIDNLPNDIQKIIENENRLLENKKLTPAQLEKEFKDSAVRFTKAKEKALGRVTELTTEIDTIQQMLDTGEGISPSRNSKNNRERLEKRLARLRSELTTRQNQLANTERAEQLLSERRNAQIERLEQLIQRQADTIEKVTAQNNRRTSTVDKVAGNFINTQVINNTYNQSFTSSNKNNFTQGNVNAYGSEGGEEYAMG